MARSCHIGRCLGDDLRNSEKFIPTDDDFRNIKEENMVEIIFENDNHQVEKLAVKVARVAIDNGKQYSYFGPVYSKPQVLICPVQGEEVSFGANHISNIYPRSQE